MDDISREDSLAITRFLQGAGKMLCRLSEEMERIPILTEADIMVDGRTYKISVKDITDEDEE